MIWIHIEIQWHGHTYRQKASSTVQRGIIIQWSLQNLQFNILRMALVERDGFTLAMFNLNWKIKRSFTSPYLTCCYIVQIWLFCEWTIQLSCGGNLDSFSILALALWQLVISRYHGYFVSQQWIGHYAHNLGSTESTMNGCTKLLSWQHIYEVTAGRVAPAEDVRISFWNCDPDSNYHLQAYMIRPLIQHVRSIKNTLFSC